MPRAVEPAPPGRRHRADYRDEEEHAEVACYPRITRRASRRVRCAAMKVAGWALVLIGLTGAAIAAGGKCIEHYGRPMCPPPSGTIVEALGQPVCGRGQCIQFSGRIMCSREPGGAAVLYLGEVRCVGGCEEAREAYCVEPRP